MTATESGTPTKPDTATGTEPARAPTAATTDREVDWSSSLGTEWPRLALVLLVFGVVLQSVDTLLAKQGFDVLVNITEAISWAVAVAVAAIGALAAVGGGIALRCRHRVAAAVLISGWALIGAGLVVVRYNTGVISGEDANSVADRVLAFLMLALYLAAGADIIYQAFKLYNPYRTRHHHTHARLARINAQLTHLEAQYIRVTHHLARTADLQATAHHHYAATLAHLDAQEPHLKDIARTTLAQLLGNPTHTPLYRHPHAPHPPEAPARTTTSASTAAK